MLVVIINIKSNETSKVHGKNIVKLVSNDPLLHQLQLCLHYSHDNSLSTSIRFHPSPGSIYHHRKSKFSILKTFWTKKIRNLFHPSNKLFSTSKNPFRIKRWFWRRREIKSFITLSGIITESSQQKYSP